MRRWIAALLAAIPLVAGAQFDHTIIRSPSGGVGTTIETIIEEFTFNSGVEEFAETAGETFGLATFTVGTPAAQTMTATRYGQFPRSRRTSAVAANSIAAWGMAGTAGGFFGPDFGYAAAIRVGFPSGFTVGQRMIVGITDGTVAGAVSGTVNPSTFFNTVYIGFDAGQATWHLCSNDLVDAATCSDLGLSIATAGMFDFYFAIAPGATTYSYTFERVDADGTKFSGTIGSDLPAAGSTGRIMVQGSTAATGVAIVIEPAVIYYFLPY